MTRSPGNPDALERLIDTGLRELGQLRAPRTLEGRILAEIERRAALPWWRKGFDGWPLVARLAFLIASAGFIKLAIAASVWAFGSADVGARLRPLTTGLRRLEHVTLSMIDLCVSLISLIPPLWLYSGLACCALLYGALFGLGAVGYSLLYTGPAPRGS